MKIFSKLLAYLSLKQSICQDNYGGMGSIAGVVIGAVIAIIVLTSQIPTITSNIATAQADANISVIPGGSALLGILGLLVMAIVVFAFLRNK